MTKNTDWEKASIAEGSTISERILTKLAKKAFLSLWSYANIYSNEGQKGGKGAGKELCDLLVVFGDHIIIFSDKHCKFNETIDIKVAWRRWYTSAIEKSARQLDGAEKFLKNYPDRIFLDHMCTSPFPVPLPHSDKAIYHLIAVTRGSHKAAAKHFGNNSSGSLILRTDLIGNAHYEVPFHVGYPLKSQRFIHVLDEMTVDVLLAELDTIADFSNYLIAKEELISETGIISISGEEDLIARYMLSENEGKRTIDIGPRSKEHLIILQEGDWHNYRNGPQQIGRLYANEKSYLWDQLIEHHSALIRAGTVVSGNEILGPYAGADENYELVVRVMASENRLSRRQLVAYMLENLEKSTLPGQANIKFVKLGKTSSRGYIFIAARQLINQSYKEYRSFRTEHARIYAFGLRNRFPQIEEIFCIASEPLDSIKTRDLLYFSLKGEIPLELQQQIDQETKKRNILRQDTKVLLDNRKISDFPVKFTLEKSEIVEYKNKTSPIDYAKPKKKKRGKKR